MTRLRLTLAMGGYDYLQPLKDGRVQAEGLDLTLLEIPCGTRHGRMLEHALYDACEFSMGTYVVARSRGIDWLEAIPFFSRRMFCQRFCFVRADSKINEPEDLRGARVGLLSYQNSLAIVFKGVLMHRHRVGLSEVTWITQASERIPVDLPDGIEVRPANVDLETLLLQGEIDALVAPDLPRAWLKRDGRLRRLYSDYEQEERDDFTESRHFPIMHPVVIQKELLERDPWIASSLYDALEGSRRLHREWAEEPHRQSVVWPQLDREEETFRRDPFAQGFRANRKDVETFIALSEEQGLLRDALQPAQLFARSTLQT